VSLFATAMKLVEVLHCSHHGPKPNSGEQQEKRVVDEKEEAEEDASTRKTIRENLKNMV
jgi:hypothetical protein